MYEVVTFSPADWVCLFETRFFLSVEHLRQRFPRGTGSLLSRVPSRVLASLRLASDNVRDRSLSLESTPSRIGSSAWFLFVRGLGQLPAVWGSLTVKASLARSASLDARPLALPAQLSLAPFQDV